MSEPGGFKHTYKPPEPTKWKIEARWARYRAACGHEVHGTVEVAYGARSEAREAEFELLWEMLREEPCPACLPD